MAEITKPLIDPDKIIKEVFGVDGIESKTELTDQQIQAISKLKTLSRLFGSEILDQHIKYFLILQKSKNRKSMSEFVDSLKSKKDQIMEKAKTFSFIG